MSFNYLLQCFQFQLMNQHAALLGAHFHTGIYRHLTAAGRCGVQIFTTVAVAKHNSSGERQFRNQMVNYGTNK